MVPAAIVIIAFVVVLVALNLIQWSKLRKYEKDERRLNLIQLPKLRKDEKAERSKK